MLVTPENVNIAGWVVEISLSWLDAYRRTVRDFEQLIESAVQWVRVAFLRIALNKLYP